MRTMVSSSNEEIVRRSMTSGKRTDSRGPLEMRSLGLYPSKTSDTLVARLGGTEVLCNIRAAVTEPHPIRQNEGFLLFKVDLSVLSGSAFLSKSIKMISNETSEILERTIKDSK